MEQIQEQVKEQFNKNNFGFWNNGDIITEKDFIFGTLENNQIKIYNELVSNGFSKYESYILSKNGVVE